MKRFMRKYLMIYLIAFALPILPLYGYASLPNAVTEAQVEFEVGQGPTYPVDPDEPETEGNTGGSEGSFLIVSVSDFEFGKMTIGATTQWLDIQTLRPNIQVVDLRGTNAGWRVSAAVSRFEDASNNPSLPGAVIHIHNGTPKSTSVSGEPVQIEDVELTADGESFPVITAAPGAGMGLWVMRWYPETEGPAYVELEVPAGSATLGAHTANIDWVLENGPST